VGQCLDNFGLVVQVLVPFLQNLLVVCGLVCYGDVKPFSLLFLDVNFDFFVLDVSAELVCLGVESVLALFQLHEGLDHFLDAHLSTLSE